MKHLQKETCIRQPKKSFDHNEIKIRSSWQKRYKQCDQPITYTSQLDIGCFAVTGGDSAQVTLWECGDREFFLEDPCFWNSVFSICGCKSMVIFSEVHGAFYTFSVFWAHVIKRQRDRFFSPIILPRMLPREIL